MRSRLAAALALLAACGQSPPSASPNAPRWVDAGVAPPAGPPGWPDAGPQARPDALRWVPLPTDGAPPAPDRHAAVWTGSELVVLAQAGARLGAAADRWHAVPGAGAPSFEDASAVWTGSEVFVLGAGAPLAGRYDPAADAWRAVSPAGAPEPRRQPVVAWTGSEVLVWGGERASLRHHALGDGARYDPAADAWRPMSAAGAPSRRLAPAAAWTGSELFVWGGERADDPEHVQPLDGARYDPAADAWTPVSTVDAPRVPVAFDGAAVWTGSEVVVLGGLAVRYYGESVGGRWDPRTDTWTRTPPIPRDGFRYGHVMVWTGSEVVVWGGAGVWGAEGLRYDLGRERFVEIPWSPDAPVRSDEGHSGVWTGSELWIYGGGASPGRGARWRP